MSSSHLHAVGHDSAAHGSFKGYVVGFILSVLLTLGSFAAVMSDVLPKGSGLTAIVVLCVAQLVVQLVYFLHIGTARDQRSNTGIFLCTALLIVIIVAGSLWVMHNANINMMPTHLTPERAKARD